MKQAILFLYCCLCIVCPHVCAEPKNQASSKRKTGSLEFVIVDRNPQTFRITNHTNRAVTLDSLFLQPSEYEYAPEHPTYEYMNGKQWIAIKWSGDTLTFSYALKPGKSVEFQGVYSQLEQLKRGTLVRLRIGALVSKPFHW